MPETKPATPATASFFYGWVVVASCFLISLLVGGMHTYSRGIFLKPIAEDIGSTRLELSIGFTITMLVAFLTAPIAGRIIDRFSVRLILVLLLGWSAIGYFAWAFIETRWQLFIVMGLFFGLASFAIDTISIPKLMVNWFHRQRGFTLALTAMGVSSAGIFAPFLAATLIELFDWRVTLLILGGVTLLIAMPIALIFIRNTPEEMGLHPDGDQQAVHDINTTTAETTLWHWQDYLSSGSFWSIAVMFGLFGAGFQVISTHIFAHMTDINISATEASFALSGMAACAMLSKPVFGWMIDHWAPRLCMLVCISFQVVAMLLLLAFKSYVAIFSALILFGLGYGGMMPLRNALTAMAFGQRTFGEIAGAIRAFMLPPLIIALPLAGWIYDTYQHYAPAFIMLLGFYGIAAISIVFLQVQRR